MQSDAGFTLVELLLATLVAVVIVGGIFALANPAQAMFATQSEVSDMQQRARIAVGELQKDLLMSGSGGYAASSRGSLVGYLAPLLPYRVGDLAADGAGSFRSDRVTLMYVPETAAQTRIASPIDSSLSSVDLVLRPGCPVGDQSCGFIVGMAAIVLDENGGWDCFTVSGVQGPTLALEHRGAGLNSIHPAGSSIFQLIMRTYWLKADPASQTFQLMRYDGHRSDAPIAENVVSLAFDYFGDPSPPQLTSASTRDTTYGPKPPELNVDNPADAWGQGENCAFASDGLMQFPRLDWLGSVNASLVTLSPAQLTDGPWCPDAAAAGRYDADLLRVRSVRARLRVQAASPTLRGRGGPLFTFAGTSLGGEHFVPDLEISLDVTPRNLSIGR
jgi:Tfp pilus assembly protein PilW